MNDIETACRRLEAWKFGTIRDPITNNIVFVGDDFRTIVAAARAYQAERREHELTRRCLWQTRDELHTEHEARERAEAERDEARATKDMHKERAEQAEADLDEKNETHDMLGTAWQYEVTRRERAERALLRAGFEDKGGKEWKPPVQNTEWIQRMLAAEEECEGLRRDADALEVDRDAWRAVARQNCCERCQDLLSLRTSLKMGNQSAMSNVEIACRRVEALFHPEDLSIKRNREAVDTVLTVARDADKWSNLYYTVESELTAIQNYVGIESDNSALEAVKRNNEGWRLKYQRIMAALRDTIELVEGLADQQARPDNWYAVRLRAAKSLLTAI